MRALTRTLTLANDAREQDHTHHVESLKMCCGVLAILSRDEANKLLIARDGMRLLCAIMEQHLGRADLLEAACDLLWSLAFNNPLMKEVIGRQGGIPAILLAMPLCCYARGTPLGVYGFFGGPDGGWDYRTWAVVRTPDASLLSP